MTRPSTNSVVAAMAVIAVLMTASSGASPAGPREMAASLGNGNINGYLANRDLVMAQINCVKGVTACNRLGEALKKAIPVVINNCTQCTQSQAQNARKLIDYVRINHPQDYQVILKKYSKQRAG